MKKAFLSIAIFALSTILISAFAVNFNSNKISMFTQQDDGFVTVKLEELNENVQNAISALNQNYEVDSLKFNAEKQLTQVQVTGKEDQSVKTIYFNQQGEEVMLDEERSDEGEVQLHKEGEETPSVEIFYAVSQDDDGFVTVKFDDLNENVQKAISALIQTYELNALEYNADKQVTKVKATSKEDQTEKTFYFDNEGKEVNAPANDVPEREETEISLF